MNRDDAELFTQVFERHRHAVHAYFLGHVADPELARDLLQETFLRVWRRLAVVRPLDTDRQRAWIFTVARNLAIDSYRSRATRESAAAALEHRARLPAAVSTDPADQVEWADQLAALHKAIHALPTEQRVILSMATVAELTSRQIGDALGQPAGTVRYKLGQARRHLAATLDLKG